MYSTHPLHLPTTANASHPKSRNSQSSGNSSVDTSSSSSASNNDHTIHDNHQPVSPQHPNLNQRASSSQSVHSESQSRSSSESQRGMYNLLKEKRQQEKFAAADLSTKKKRQSQSQNSSHDTHEIVEHSKHVMHHGSHELNAPAQNMAPHKHYKKASINSYRTSSDASLSINNPERQQPEQDAQHQQHEKHRGSQPNSHHSHQSSKSKHSLKQSTTHPTKHSQSSLTSAPQPSDATQAQTLVHAHTQQQQQHKTHHKQSYDSSHSQNSKSKSKSKSNPKTLKSKKPRHTSNSQQESPPPFVPAVDDHFAYMQVYQQEMAAANANAPPHKKHLKRASKKSKLSEFGKQHRQFLQLADSEDTRSQLSEQSVEFLGQVNHRSPPQPPQPPPPPPQQQQKYIDEERSDPPEDDEYQMWKPELGQRQISITSNNSNSLNSNSMNTITTAASHVGPAPPPVGPVASSAVIQLQKSGNSASTSSSSASQPTSPRSRSQSRESQQHADEEDDNRSITEMTREEVAMQPGAGAADIDQINPRHLSPGASGVTGVAVEDGDDGDSNDDDEDEESDDSHDADIDAQMQQQQQQQQMRLNVIAPNLANGADANRTMKMKNYKSNESMSYSAASQDSSVVSPLSHSQHTQHSHGASHMYSASASSKNYYHGHHIYAHANKHMHQPIDRIRPEPNKRSNQSMSSSSKPKKPSKSARSKLADDDRLSIYSMQSHQSGESLNSISTSQTESMKYFNAHQPSLQPNLPPIKSQHMSHPSPFAQPPPPQHPQPPPQRTSHGNYNKQQQQQELRTKLQQQIAVQREFEQHQQQQQQQQQQQLLHPQHSNQSHGLMPPEDAISVTYTEEESRYESSGDDGGGGEEDDRYDDEETATEITDLRDRARRNSQSQHKHNASQHSSQLRRHKSVDSATTNKTYEPSVFTDIDYDLDYSNVGIKDIVWTQKLKYLKYRLIFLESEIAALPPAHQKLDKLMLYAALEFLSINPDEKKADDRLVEWWDLHKYSWLDQHDPQKENTLASQNWNEIGIPLTRPKGSAPTHHNKTLFEDIYDNLKRAEWVDPISVQSQEYAPANEFDDTKSVKSGKSVAIPSTIKFDRAKYKDYDRRNTRSHLMDGADFLQFLRRQTSRQMARHKSGLVGYVNVSVEDKIAECTPWKLHRIFSTSVYNRIQFEQHSQLLQRHNSLQRAEHSQQDKVDKYRAQIQQLKQLLSEQKALVLQTREQHRQELEYIKQQQQQHNPHPQQSYKPSSAKAASHAHHRLTSPRNAHHSHSAHHLQQGKQAARSHEAVDPRGHSAAHSEHSQHEHLSRTPSGHSRVALDPRQRDRDEQQFEQQQQQAQKMYLRAKHSNQSSHSSSHHSSSHNQQHAQPPPPKEGNSYSNEHSQHSSSNSSRKKKKKDLRGTSNTVAAVAVQAQAQAQAHRNHSSEIHKHNPMPRHQPFNPMVTSKSHTGLHAAGVGHKRHYTQPQQLYGRHSGRARDYEPQRKRKSRSKGSAAMDDQLHNRHDMHMDGDHEEVVEPLAIAPYSQPQAHASQPVGKRPHSSSSPQPMNSTEIVLYTSDDPAHHHHYQNNNSGNSNSQHNLALQPQESYNTASSYTEQTDLESAQPMPSPVPVQAAEHEQMQSRRQLPQRTSSNHGMPRNHPNDGKSFVPNGQVYSMSAVERFQNYEFQSQQPLQELPHLNGTNSLNSLTQQQQQGHDPTPNGIQRNGMFYGAAPHDTPPRDPHHEPPTPKRMRTSPVDHVAATTKKNSSNEQQQHHQQAPRHSSKPSCTPTDVKRTHKQRRDLASARKQASAVWNSYVSRYAYIKEKFPAQCNDRNKAWLQWTKMLDDRDRNPEVPLSDAQLWSFIDFGRLSMARYANWVWYPERPDMIRLNSMKINASKKSKSTGDSNDGGAQHRNDHDNRTYISDKQYYDHQQNLIWTKKFAIAMDFNLFLFDEYSNPNNLLETLNYEHSILSLASCVSVVKSKKNGKDFYLNTSDNDGYNFLQFRVDGRHDDDDKAQRNEWMEELDYQIHIVHDLLAIDHVSMQIADSSATVWLPAPAPAPPAAPTTTTTLANNKHHHGSKNERSSKKSSHKHKKTHTHGHSHKIGQV